MIRKEGWGRGRVHSVLLTNVRLMVIRFIEMMIQIISDYHEHKFIAPLTSKQANRISLYTE